MKYLAGGSGLLLAVVMLVVVASVALLNEQSCGSGAPSVSAPASSLQTGIEMIQYLESQGISANGAAGIVGNLQQESGLDPTEPGQGLAQWNPSWWAQLVSYDKSVGQSPQTVAGQLMYIAFELHSSYSWLLGALNSATSPQQAAVMWETGYEKCSGVTGWMEVAPGSLCMSENRQNYAAQALLATAGSIDRGATELVSYAPGQVCNESYALTGIIAGYTNPFAQATGIEWTRTDQGVDACMRPGSPLLALAPSKYLQAVPDFYDGQPAMVLQVTNGPLAGKYWYWSEQITPTIGVGQTVAAGQTVATYAPAGTCIEIGWWALAAGRPLGGVEGYTEGYSTLSGADFRYLLTALGAHPGTGAGLSIPHPVTIGSAYYP
ncbi:MAG: hypothetical protein JOY58_09220 [Solirubrobacterales bacterium]|nr:hypothetical protein [Solirubrobacterales bacterium]